jgi:predicted ester cyclase
MGMPATGKPINIQALEFLRFGADGLIHEHWGVLDMMTLMQQLGAAQGAPV